MKQGIGLKARVERRFGFRRYLIDQRCLARPTTRAAISISL
jgi:hypothetical protein